MIKKLRSILSPRDKQFLFLLLIFSIFISLIETVGISVVMPFIAVASDFNLIENNQYYSYFYQLVNFNSKVNFVLCFGFLLIIFYVFRSGINLFYFYMLAKFSQGRYHVLAFRLFENYIGMSYRNFIDKNTSQLNKTIVTEANYLTVLLQAVLFMLSEVFVIVFIYSIMLYVDWKITLTLTLILVFNALFLTNTVSKKIKLAGENRAKFQKRFFEIINSTLDNFKLLKLKSNDRQILDRFAKASSGFAKSNITNIALSHFPRLFLEAIGFGIVVSIVIFLVYKYKTDVSNVLAIISMFVLALYRLMPSVNRIMSSYNQIIFHYKSLDIVYSELMYAREKLEHEKIEFNKHIELKNIDFGYIQDKLVLNKINLIIKKGHKIAFIGESGSGKSTLVDIIIGLYKPCNGQIFVDNQKMTDKNIRSLRKMTGYIPQSIYLFDGTVAENVVFGDEYNEDRIKQVLKQANILDFLEKEQNGIHTKVGEGGIKLSGGQKQRIAIARALYPDPEILVLDEATSSLDDETEFKIMDEIYNVAKEKTLIVIAHRLSTIKRCGKVYKLENKKIWR